MATLKQLDHRHHEIDMELLSTCRLMSAAAPPRHSTTDEESTSPPRQYLDVSVYCEPAQKKASPTKQLLDRHDALEQREIEVLWEDSLAICNHDDNRKNNKCVSFDEEVQECTYYRKRLSKHERKLVWYSTQEIKKFRTEICALNVTALCPKKGPRLRQVIEDVDTWRGLEHVREGQLMGKLEHRQDFVKAFLYFAKDLGVSDGQALAVYSTNNSKRDLQRALQLAERDSFEAFKIYHAMLETNKKDAKQNKTSSSFSSFSKKKPAIQNITVVETMSMTSTSTGSSSTCSDSVSLSSKNTTSSAPIRSSSNNRLTWRLGSSQPGQKKERRSLKMKMWK